MDLDVPIEMLTPRQKRQFNQKRIAEHSAAGQANEPTRGRCSPARRDDIVVNQHDITFRHGIDVHLDAVGTILKFVIHCVRFIGQLPFFPNRHKSGAEAVCERRTQDEAPRLDSRHFRDTESFERSGEGVDRLSKQILVAEYRGDIFKYDAG